jgi:hypothetical protein
MLMEITRLKPGELAPDATDRIHINKLPNGKHGWSGSVGLRDAAVFGVGKNEDRSVHQAEAEAIAWAKHHGATELMIETDA